MSAARRKLPLYKKIFIPRNVLFFVAVCLSLIFTIYFTKGDTSGNNMGYTAPQTVSGYVTLGTPKTFDLTSSITPGADGFVVTGISGITNYGGGSPTSMVVRLYSGAHSVSFIVAIPGGSTNQPFYVPLTIPARFVSGLNADLTATYAFASIQVYDFTIHYTPLPL